MTNPGFRPWAVALLAIVLAAHITLSVRQFPSIRSIVDPKTPVLVVDHAIHEYHGALGARFLHEHGTTWGYDPFFMAGYPETPVWDSSSNLSILFQTLAGGRYSPAAYKVGLLVCLILTVAMVPAGAWGAGLGETEVAVAALLAWFVFWTGFAADLWRTGLFAFEVASGGLPLLIGLALRVDTRPTVGRWAALTVTGALLVFAHVTTPILALGAVVGFAAAAARRHDQRWAAAMVAAPVLALLANAFWLVPLWRFRGIRTPSFIFMSTDTAWYLWYFLRGPGPDSRNTLALLILGGAGLALWWAEGARVRAAAFGGGALALLALFGFGSLWGVTLVLEPLRFRVPLVLLLAVPAASALCRTAGWATRAFGGGRRGGALTALGGAALVAGLAFATPFTFRFAGARCAIAWSRPLVVGLRPEMHALVRALRMKTDPSARVLFEDQLRLLEATDPESVHWTPLLPFLLQPDARQLIGGLYHTAFIAHNRAASFGDFQLGGRYIEQWSPGELTAYFDRYNIGWVVCWSPLSRFTFDHLPAARRIAVVPRYGTPYRRFAPEPHTLQVFQQRTDPATAMKYLSEAESLYAIYRIERPHSFFLRGTGQVSAVDANRVELSGVVPDGGEVVLSLHWLETWRTDPPLAVGPTSVPGDQVPFIRIKLDGPAERVVLFNGYGDRP
ncbi:MAG: hypothetical protein P4L84_19485 [Isosphaeraceae bacterium]|nr:hypothetical protein [Isosphaeraceae bacterium]